MARSLTERQVVLLRVLAESEHPLHVSQVSLRALGRVTGTVDQTLWRMSISGLVQPRSLPPSSRTWEITEQGRRALMSL